MEKMQLNIYHKLILQVWNKIFLRHLPPRDAFHMNIIIETRYFKVQL